MNLRHATIRARRDEERTDQKTLVSNTDIEMDGFCRIVINYKKSIEPKLATMPVGLLYSAGLCSGSVVILVQKRFFSSIFLCPIHGTSCNWH